MHRYIHICKEKKYTREIDQNSEFSSSFLLLSPVVHITCCLSRVRDKISHQEPGGEKIGGGHTHDEKRERERERESEGERERVRGGERERQNRN